MACLIVTKGSPVRTRLANGAMSRSAVASSEGAAARYKGIGVAAGDPDMAGTRGQDGLGAGRRAAVMIARLERHHDCVHLFGQASGTGLRYGLGFGMRQAGPPMSPAGQYLTLYVEQDAADRRIGRGCALIGSGQVQRVRKGTQYHMRRKFCLKGVCGCVHARLVVTSDEFQGK